MNRILLAFIASILAVASASAGPIPWMYSVTLRPANYAEGIHLGNETYWEYDHSTGIEKGTAYHVLSNIGPNGYVRSGSETPTETFDLFSFGHGEWQLKQQLPTDQTLAMNRFMLGYAFTAGDSQTEIQSGVFEGHISASGVFTSGTGNFNIGLDESTTIAFGDRKARVRFSTRSAESHSTITMQVTEVVETPEPATIALAGIGLVGVFLKRRRAK